jgi:holo-[acyl-carrier protein] synthase
MQAKQRKRVNSPISELVCGVDIVELERFARVLEVGGTRFLHRVYTKAELTFCAGRLPQLAVRFAAKEAISKALGTGIQGGIHWGEMEINSDLHGCPFVSLYGHAAARAEQMHIGTWAVSLSHSPHVAIAFVVASRMKRSDPEGSP